MHNIVSHKQLLLLPFPHVPTNQFSFEIVQLMSIAIDLNNIKLLHHKVHEVKIRKNNARSSIKYNIFNTYHTSDAQQSLIPLTSFYELIASFTI